MVMYVPSTVRNSNFSTTVHGVASVKSTNTIPHKQAKRLQYPLHNAYLSQLFKKAKHEITLLLIQRKTVHYGPMPEQWYFSVSLELWKFTELYLIKLCTITAAVCTDSKV